MNNAANQPERGPVSENIKPDDETDTVLVYGVRVSGELMRAFTEPTPEGTWLRIIKVSDGPICVEVRTDLVRMEQTL